MAYQPTCGIVWDKVTHKEGLMMVKRVPDNIEDIMKSAKNGDTIAMQTLSGQLSGLIWREYTRQDTQIKPNDWYSEAQYVLYRALASSRGRRWLPITKRHFVTMRNKCGDLSIESIHRLRLLHWKMKSMQMVVD